MKRHVKQRGQIEVEGLTVLDSLFTPTIEMAAELLNVSADLIKEWLVNNELELDAKGHLSESAIEFLSGKFVKRLHKYFDNCVSAGENLGDEEQALFKQFKGKYGKFYRIRINKWGDIDTHRIARDFKNELKRKAVSAFYDNFEAFEFPEVVLSKAIPLESVANQDPQTRLSLLLHSIPHSLYFGSRIKTKIPTRPESRNIVLETLQENRFHIFSGESDSNALIDATPTLQVKQPQLAIANVFGYTRRKNNRSHETRNKTQAYSRS